MTRENPERNAIIYNLWEQGLTVDEIAFETGIPRSTVGYYVRKFNKRAMKGEEIVIPQVGEQANPKDLAFKAFVKSWALIKLFETIKEGDIDRVHKSLMTLKLFKELQRDFILTTEEEKALSENLVYVIEQYAKECELANELGFAPT